MRNEGTAPGQIGLSGSSVTFGGATIGTLSGGGNGSDLVITLNANATVDAVENLIENLTYASTSQSPAASRMIGIRVSDGDGGACAPASITINVVQELDGMPGVYFGERVNTYSASTQDEPQIAVLTDGSYVIVWTSYGQDSTNTDGIYAQRFNRAVALSPHCPMGPSRPGSCASSRPFWRTRISSAARCRTLATCGTAYRATQSPAHA